jgi:hypothetical protein
VFPKFSYQAEALGINAAIVTGLRINYHKFHELIACARVGARMRGEKDALSLNYKLGVARAYIFVQGRILFRSVAAAIKQQQCAG